MANNKKKLDDLIDALGQIDDRFIHEAENVTPFTFAGFRRKKSRLLPMLIAAALSCALLLAGAAAILIPPAANPTPDRPGSDSGTLAGLTSAPVQEPPQEDDNASESPKTDDLDERDPLQLSLLSLTEHQIASLDSIGEDELFLDGVCRLVWSYGDGRYYAVSVTDRNDLRQLEAYLSDPDSIVPAGEQEDLGLRFWICTGYGVSATPYLLYGAWGVGNLFDYNPESLPSSDFASFLTELIQKNLA